MQTQKVKVLFWYKMYLVLLGMNPEDGSRSLLPRGYPSQAGLVEGGGTPQQQGAPGLWNPGPEYRELRRPILPVTTSYSGRNNTYVSLNIHISFMHAFIMDLFITNTALSL
jgi:hypothetical protein